MLWLLQRTPRSRASILVWPFVLLIAWPAWDDRDGPTPSRSASRPRSKTPERYVDANLRPGEVAIVPSYSPFEDSRYFELVQIYVEHTPDYPYRSLPATTAARSFAQAHGIRPRFYVGPEADGPHR